MVDVFVCSLLGRGFGVRDALFTAVIRRWRLDNDAIAFPIFPETIRCDHESFQRFRRIKADEIATTEVYVLTDDDCMPIGVNFIARGLEIMARHPDFGILAALNIRSNTLFKNGIPPYTGQFIDDEVWECHAVGGIRFCRKGIIKKWPESETPGSYDCQHHEALVNAGYRAGYMRSVLFNHLGEGLSQHWPEVTEIDQLYKNGETVNA